MIDKELHIICSAALTLILGAKPALIIGVALEVFDIWVIGDVEESVKDMAANVIGVGIASVFKK